MWNLFFSEFFKCLTNPGIRKDRSMESANDRGEERYGEEGKIRGNKDYGI